MKLKTTRFIRLERIEDGDGSISVAEELREIPFQIRRIYYIYDLENPETVRGKHAHRHLEQVIFCLHGSLKLTLDDGDQKEVVTLNQPNVGVYLGSRIWFTMTDFSDDCVLLVFASEYYSEADYIRNYDEFLEYVKTIE